ENGEVPVDIFALRNISHQIMLQCRFGRHAKYGNFALGEFNKPHDRLEQSRFSRAVNTDECRDGSGRDCKACIMQSRMTIPVSDCRVYYVDSFFRSRVKGFANIYGRTHCLSPSAIVRE